MATASEKGVINVPSPRPLITRRPRLNVVTVALTVPTSSIIPSITTIAPVTSAVPPVIPTSTLKPFPIEASREEKLLPPTLGPRQINNPILTLEEAKRIIIPLGGEALISQPKPVSMTVSAPAENKTKGGMEIYDIAKRIDIAKLNSTATKGSKTYTRDALIEFLRNMKESNIRGKKSELVERIKTILAQHNLPTE